MIRSAVPGPTPLSFISWARVASLILTLLSALAGLSSAPAPPTTRPSASAATAAIPIVRPSPPRFIARSSLRVRVDDIVPVEEDLSGGERRDQCPKFDTGPADTRRYIPGSWAFRARGGR